MLDEQGKTVGPDRFLSAANRYQLMPEIDRWVIDKAIESLKPHAAVLAGAIKLVTSHIKPEHRDAAQRTLARMRGETV